MSKQESWTVRYQKLRELGKGGNAKVYLVKRFDRSEEYALKTLNTRGAEKQSRFIDEIHVMRDNYATIEGILPVFDYSEADFWYTMPVAEPVMNYIERNRSSIKSIVLYSISLCDTLIELHRRGISHRDIKPSKQRIVLLQKTIAALTSATSFFKKSRKLQLPQNFRLSLFFTE